MSTDDRKPNLNNCWEFCAELHPVVTTAAVVQNTRPVRIPMKTEGKRDRRERIATKGYRGHKERTCRTKTDLK